MTTTNAEKPDQREKTKKQKTFTVPEISTLK